MIHFRRIASSFVLLLWVAGVAVAQDDAIERRINALIQQMTIEEKAGQLSQYDSLSPQTIELAKKGLVGSFLNVLGAENTNKTQKLAMESRLKIPILFGFDVIHGYRTVFPVPIGSGG